MTKLVVLHEGSRYLLDLGKAKALSWSQVFSESGDETPLVVATSEAEALDLDKLLEGALTSKPTVAKPTGTQPTGESKTIRSWYEGLGDKERAEVTPEGITLKERGVIPGWLSTEDYAKLRLKK